jgi:hypothetical protein
MVRRNSGVMTMHYRVVHSGVANEVVSNYFKQKDVDGVLKVECTLCGRVFRRNVQIMNVHFKMMHGPPESANRHVCSLEKVSIDNSSGLHTANTTETDNAGACEHGGNHRGAAGTPNRTLQVAECLQRLDAVAQRYSACAQIPICADRCSPKHHLVLATS